MMMLTIVVVVTVWVLMTMVVVVVNVLVMLRRERGMLSEHCLGAAAVLLVCYHHPSRSNILALN